MVELKMTEEEEYTKMIDKFMENNIRNTITHELKYKRYSEETPLNNFLGISAATLIYMKEFKHLINSNLDFIITSMGKEPIEDNEFRNLFYKIKNVYNTVTETTDLIMIKNHILYGENQITDYQKLIKYDEPRLNDILIEAIEKIYPHDVYYPIKCHFSINYCINQIINSVKELKDYYTDLIYISSIETNNIIEEYEIFKRCLNNETIYNIDNPDGLSESSYLHGFENYKFLYKLFKSCYDNDAELYRKIVGIKIKNLIPILIHNYSMYIDRYLTNKLIGIYNSDY